MQAETIDATRGLNERLQDPQTVAALNRLLDQADDLSNSIQQARELQETLPNLLAMATDVFDEYAIKLKAQGIDLETSLRQGLHAVLWLGSQIRTEELDRLGYLLRSDVMNEHSVETVGMAGSALASCRRGTCEHPVPKRIGLLGLFSAMRDPNTQRALAFAVQFAKCFGGVLEKSKPDSCDDSSCQQKRENL